MTTDTLGDRMKAYEAQYSGRQLLPLVPVVARMDGRAFHTFTADLKRPYDERLSNLMIATTRHLVRETGAVVGYTQSDEISLVWYVDRIGTELLFDGKLLKMTSVLASMTTAYFNLHLLGHLPDKALELPLFDARVFNLPRLWEATNYLIWREMDATRNSISMAAQSMFSHRELHGKSSNEMQEMMFQKHGVNWNDYPTFFKRGTYLARRPVVRKFTAKDLEGLPEKHHARTDLDFTVTRHDVVQLDLPPLRRLANREDVIFEGADPLEKTEEVTEAVDS